MQQQIGAGVEAGGRHDVGPGQHEIPHGEGLRLGEGSRATVDPRPGIVIPQLPVAVVVSVSIHAAGRVLASLPIRIVVNLGDLSPLTVEHAHKAAAHQVIFPAFHEGVIRVGRHPVGIELVMVHVVRAIAGLLSSILVKQAVPVVIAGRRIGRLALSLVRVEEDAVAIGVHGRDRVHRPRVQQVGHERVAAIPRGQVPHEVQHRLGADGLAGVVLPVNVQRRPAIRIARRLVAYPHRQDGPTLPRLTNCQHPHQLRIGGFQFVQKRRYLCGCRVVGEINREGRVGERDVRPLVGGQGARQLCAMLARVQIVETLDPPEPVNRCRGLGVAGGRAEGETGKGRGDQADSQQPSELHHNIPPAIGSSRKYTIIFT